MSNVVEFPKDKVPEFIRPANLSTMTEEQVELLVANARTTRFVKSAALERARKGRQKANESGKLARYDRHIEKMVKLIDKLDKTINDLETAHKLLRAEQLVLGIEE